MNTTEKTIESLFNKVEDYSKTSIELLKLNAIDKFADMVSSLLGDFIQVWMRSLDLFANLRDQAKKWERMKLFP